MTTDPPRDPLALIRAARATIRQLLDDDGFSGTLPSSVRQTLRQVRADLDEAVAASTDQAGAAP